MRTKLEFREKNEPLNIIYNVIMKDSFVHPEFLFKNEKRKIIEGSEGSVLFSSKNEPLLSLNFTQCSAALSKNLRTGRVFLIHQSNVEKQSSKIIMHAQKTEDLDVITITNGSFPTLFDWLQSYQNMKLGKNKQEYSEFSFSKVPMYFDHTKIMGLSKKQVESMLASQARSNKKGKLTSIAKIKLPLGENHQKTRWHLLYRPKENLIRIYSNNNIIIYPGFD